MILSFIFLPTTDWHSFFLFTLLFSLFYFWMCFLKSTRLGYQAQDDLCQGLFNHMQKVSAQAQIHRSSLGTRVSALWWLSWCRHSWSKLVTAFFFYEKVSCLILLNITLHFSLLGSASLQVLVWRFGKMIVWVNNM